MKKTLIIYSFSHFVVDLLCAFTVFSIPRFHIEARPDMLFYIVLYGIIAFGTQFIFGAICDRINKPKQFALAGVSLNFLALFILLFSPLYAVILTGIGNALFHVGGGVASLHMGDKKATIPGIFVSTGAMGVFLGTYLPLNYDLPIMYIGIFGLLSILLISLNKLPKIKYEKFEKLKHFNLIILITVFILIAICVRSIIGFVVPFEWKTGFTLGIIFTCAVILGKALGGVLGDKFGFDKVALTSLTISCILLSFFSNNPILGTIGIFLFNMTMPITLVVLANSLGGRKGFAFGLTTLALIIGAMPYYAGMRVASHETIFILISLSAISIGFGLYYYRRLIGKK